MSTAQHDPHSHQRSLSVWAFVLIAVGVIWLLLQAGIFSGAHLAVLFRFSPLLLVAIGVELLLGRSARTFARFVVGGTVLLLLALMVVGPSLGLAGNSNVQTSRYTEPLDDSIAARMNIDFSVGSVDMRALTDSNLLIDADLRYLGEVEFDTSTANGETQVTLKAQNEGEQSFGFFGFSLGNMLGENDLRWAIGLTPSIPLDLNLTGGVGTNTLDFSGVQLSSLSYDGGVGETTISLPSGSYDLDLHAGVGGLRVNFVAETGVDARIEGGVGSVVLDLPNDAPIRLEVEGTLGNITVPQGFNQLDKEQDFDESGIWETASYSTMDDSARIRIVFDGGVGGLTVR